MERVHIPTSLLKVAEQLGYAVVDRDDLDDQVALTTFILEAALTMYSTLEQIGSLPDTDAKPAIELAQSTRAEIDGWLWRNAGRSA